MALTKVSGPLLHGSNDNLGNYVINNITGAAATFSSVSVGGTLTYDDVTSVESVGLITAKSGIHVTGGSVRVGNTTTTANGNADNLVIGEITGNHGITILSGQNAVGNLFFGDIVNNSAAGIQYFHADNHMEFRIAGGEKVRFTSGGFVGIGTETPSKTLHVDGTIFASGATTSLDGGLRIQPNNDGTNYGGVIYGGAHNDNNHAIYMRRGQDGLGNTVDINSYAIFRVLTGGALASQEERLRITNQGLIGINYPNTTTGLTISKYGTLPVPNGNTYPYPAGKWSSTWNTTTANNEDYWVGFTGSYNVSSATVNICLQPNTFNFSTQQGIYIAGEATATDAADFTVGKLIGGSVGGASTVAGTKRATKDELFRIKSDGKVGIGSDNPGATLDLYSEDTEILLRLNTKPVKNGYLDIVSDANRRGVIRFKDSLPDGGNYRWSIGNGDSDELPNTVEPDSS